MYGKAKQEIERLLEQYGDVPEWDSDKPYQNEWQRIKCPGCGNFDAGTIDIGKDSYNCKRCGAYFIFQPSVRGNR